MTIYRVTLTDGQKFQMNANLVQASASISVNFHGGDDDWQGTPYQTADARHDATRAAELVAEYFRAGPDDCTEVETVETNPEPAHLKVRGAGGTQWDVVLIMSDGEEIDSSRYLDFGEIGDDEQWQGDNDELEQAAREHMRDDRKVWRRNINIPDDLPVNMRGRR